MPRHPLGEDTSFEVEEKQVDAWRRMSPAQKAALVTGLTQAAVAMTAAGVRFRHPHASPREQFLRLAVLLLGSGLAARAYPDAAMLEANSR